MSQPFNTQHTKTFKHSRHLSFDDKHLISKHNSIYPTHEEINAIKEIVTSTEKALKLVSEQISEEDGQLRQQQIPKTDANENNQNSNNEIVIKSETPKNQEKESTLKGVVRVGLLAKGLLLKGDTNVKLVVVCSETPTKTLLEHVHKILVQKIEVVSPETKYSILLDKDAEAICIVRLNINDLHPIITCRVMLTSPTVRDNDDEQLENISEIKKEEKEFLDKQKCLDSLADLRHAKWFQAKASQVPNCVISIRILRDLCRRNPTWSTLSQWALELLVERSLGSLTQQISLGESFRRVLECVSSGIILPNGSGLLDPCEKKSIDATDCLKKHQREELTASDQMALRLLACKQIYKILGIECLVNNFGEQKQMPKKRSLEIEIEENQEGKKEKKNDELYE